MYKKQNLLPGVREKKIFYSMSLLRYLITSVYKLYVKGYVIRA